MRLIDADALIKEYEEILEKTLADFCETERMMCREVIRALQNAPTIEPIEDTKSCGVSADTSADQNVENVPSGDTISRADAIKAVKETKPTVRSTERNWGKMIAEQHSKELVKALKALPSADRPRGEWTEKEVMVDEDTNITEWQSARCSVCGRYHTTPFMYYFDNFNFCPSCGADMRPEK